MPPIVAPAVSSGVVLPIATSPARGELAACASEVLWTVPGVVPAKESKFGPPTSRGSLRKGGSITTRNTEHKEKRLGTRVYPSRVPKDSGFFLLVRFADGADALPDGHFAPPTGASMSFTKMARLSDGCSGAVGVTAFPALASAALLAAASASASAFLVATSCST